MERRHLLWFMGIFLLSTGPARSQPTHALAGTADAGDWGLLLAFEQVADLPYGAIPAPVFRPSFRGGFVGGLPGPGDLVVQGHVGGDGEEQLYWAGVAGLRLAPHGPERTFRPAISLTGGVRSVPLSPSIGYSYGSAVSTHPAVGVGRLEGLFEIAREGDPTAFTVRIRYETHWTWLTERHHDGTGAERQAPLLASQLVDLRFGFVIDPLDTASFFFEAGAHIYSPFQPEERYEHVALIVSAGAVLGSGPSR